MEWGDTAATDDATATPRAEGGMFKNTGNMIYGLYFGSESDTSQSLRTLAMGTGGDTATTQEMNNLDIFIAGDAGVQWGVRLTNGSYENETNDSDASQTRLTVGVVSGNIDSFLNFGVANNADDGAGGEFEGAGSIDFGVTYAMGDMDLYARYSTITAEDANDDEYSRTDTTIGVAKNYKLNDKANAWASAYYTISDQENDFTAVSATGESNDTFLPIVIGVEVMAKEWLTLRGSVVHEVIGTTEADNGDVSSRTDSTTVNAGASLVFGDLSIDGIVGNSRGVEGADATATENTDNVGSDTSTGGGLLRSDTLMTRVSMTYKF